MQLVLGEDEQIVLTVSEQVIAETERSLAKKAPRGLAYYRDLLVRSGVRIVRHPGPAELQAHAAIISHPPDVAIVVAAMLAKVDYLVTLNRRHFIDDPRVAERSGLRIGTPGDALGWVREQA